jgi:hypothetical protein
MAQAFALPRRPALQGESELSMGVDRTATQPVDLNSLLPKCAFLNEAVTSGGKDLANPLWNLTTLISTFTQGGRADAHRMACGHASYTKEATDDLYDRKERERAAKGLGWPACRTISASGATQCAGCPHYVQNKSPLNLAVKPAPSLAAPQNAGPSVAAAPVGNGLLQPQSLGSDLPVGYKRDGRSIVCHVVIDQDGSSTDDPICSYPMTKPWLQPTPEYTLNFTTTTEVGSSTQISIATSICSSKQTLRGALLARGLAVTENETKKISDFFMSWIQHLQKNKANIVSSAPFGWALQANGDIEGFIFGGQKFTPAGALGASCPDPVLQRQYKPTGKRDHWIRAAQLITSQGRPALDAIIASAFAGPLIKFTGESGAVMSVWSQESGIGKTSALKVAQAVWGDPVRAMQGLSDTELSVTKKMGALANLPVYWDELKSEDQHKKFVKLAFDLTSRKERTRLRQDASFRESGSWQTMLISASNAPIADYVAQMAKQTLAGMYRTFEYEIAPSNGQGQIDQADASKIIAKVDNHYGQIGLEYALFLGSNHAKVEQEVEDVYKQVGIEMQTANEERFWRVMVATLLQGAMYANMLGYTEINLPALKVFLIGVVNSMRTSQSSTPVDMRSKSNVSNVLAQYINQMRSKNTIMTNVIHRAVGKPKKDAIKILCDMAKLDAVYVHIGVDDKNLRISKTHFHNWLEKNGYSQFVLNKALALEFGAKEEKGRLGAGTGRANPQEYLIEIDLSKTTHINFLDEV